MNFLEICGIVFLSIIGLLSFMIIYYWAKYKRFIATKLIGVIKMMRYFKQMQDGGLYGFPN